jgi:NADH-quinone oxidoreductase subunit L
MNNLLALIPLLPLAGFLILSLAGKKLPKNAIAFIGAGSVSAAAVIAIILVFNLCRRHLPAIRMRWLSGIG